MMIIRGVNVFPSQIEAALLSEKGTLPHYQIVLERKGGLDQIEVRVEVSRTLFADRVSEIEAMRKRIGQAIENTIGLRVPVHLVEPQSINRSEGKAKRVLDLRHQQEEFK